MQDTGTLSAGFVVADRYRLLRPIGRGGSSVVWLGEHIVTRKHVALKVLCKHGFEVSARFLREARIASHLSHPNVVPVHDVFQLEEDDALVMVMDLLDGRALADRLRESRTLSVGETAKIVIAVASALEAAQEHGIVHRDLKPENVFLTNDGDVKVLDFGIAKWSRFERDRARADAHGDRCGAGHALLHGARTSLR